MISLYLTRHAINLPSASRASWETRRMENDGGRSGKWNSPATVKWRSFNRLTLIYLLLIFLCRLARPFLPLLGIYHILLRLPISSRLQSDEEREKRETIRYGEFGSFATMFLSIHRLASPLSVKTHLHWIYAAIFAYVNRRCISISRRWVINKVLHPQGRNSSNT